MKRLRLPVQALLTLDWEGLRRFPTAVEVKMIEMRANILERDGKNKKRSRKFAEAIEKCRTLKIA